MEHSKTALRVSCAVAFLAAQVLAVQVNFNSPSTIAYYSASISANTVGDFNGDGIPDLAIGTSGTLQILLGNGDGTFRALAPEEVKAIGNVAVGDFNGDGSRIWRWPAPRIS